MSRPTSKRLCLLVVCFLALLGFGKELHAQQVTVHGTVVSDGGVPVKNAIVAVKGTNTATRTGDSGEFTLAVPGANATLVVSRLGFARREFPLDGRTDVTISLTANAVSLDSIVVVGYGTQKRSDVTGSVASVDTTRLQNTSGTNLVQALQGAVPGVSITTTATGAEQDNLSIIIRGRNSIKASNTPLVVVDGIPYGGSLSEINQSDIASIQILKDASAAAIYGSRGSNGVILITTKKGGGGKARLSYSGNAGVQQITNMPHIMTGPEFAAYKCQRLNGGTDCESSLTATELANLQAGNFTDWVDLATRTGFQQEHNLSVAGGDSGTSYYVAGSVLDVQGVAKNDDFERYTGRVNLDQKIKSWLSIGTNTQLSLTDRGGMPASFTDAFFMNPLTDPYNADGTLTTTPWPEDVFWGNPLEGLVTKNDDKSRRVFTSNYLQVDFPFLEGLSYRFNGGIDFASRDQGTYYGRNTRTGETTQGRAITDHTTRYDWTAENILRYTREFGKHSVDVTALYSAAGENLDSDHLRAEGFPNDVLTYYQANVAALLVPSNTVTHSRLVSQMGRFNYGYDDRYLLTLTARRDGASVFGANHKYGVFPSVAVGWNIANESFWPFQKSVSTLKLRASYGKNGNQAINPYQTLARLDDDSYVDGPQTAPGYIPATLGNPNLKWETTTSLNVGLDFGLWQNRLHGSIDVYKARTSDLLLDRLISPVHGVTHIAENIGKTQNRGIEFALSSLNLQRGDFTWTTDFNIAANRNKIVDLYGNGEDDVLNGWFIGKPIDVNYAYKFDGIWQEGDDIANSAQPDAKPGYVLILDANGDHQITPDDRVFIGSLQPSYTAGLTNTLSYKGFTLSGFLRTVQGVTRANGLMSTNLTQAGVRRNIIYHQYWTPDNPINTYPSNIDGDESNALSVQFYQDASYIRLQDLTLSYDLPESFTRRLSAASLRLYVNGRNLWTHTNWTGLDPELDAQRAIPLERVIIGGIDVRF
jgi:TonB-linked SusC/RagA family outer membrane protein